MISGAKWALLALAASMAAMQIHGQNNIRLPDQLPKESVRHEAVAQQQLETEGRNGERQGRFLLDLIGLGTGPNQDPYISKTNHACIGGDLAECFKSQALNSLNDFFTHDSYGLTQSVRIIRMPDEQLRSLVNEPFEYSTESRSEDSEWDGLVKFALRKVERFLKSSAFEIDVDPEVSEGGRYSPRFINEIAEEIDVLEDKKAPLFKRNKLKKLFIPMLLILKLFKLKLLLFLPLILGLASFKKVLGFLALVIPGVIGYFKLCKPNLQSFGGGDYYPQGPQYSPTGLGVPNYGGTFGHYHNSGYYGRGGQSSPASGGVAFRDDSTHAQDLAYQGWEYRSNADKDIKAESN